MGILDEDVARVRETTDIVALIGDHVALKRVGQRYSGLCPFHQEKTPSFSVNPALNLWHCFGCQKSGDAITFVREVEGLDFVEAVERLAQRAGISLRFDDRAQAKDRTRRARLVEAVAAAVDFYHRLLMESGDGGAARSYLRSRGFEGDAARQFSLGWAPDDWDRLSTWLQQERKLTRDDIVGAGLAFVNKANRLQDQFRARLMFPIYDGRGEPVGFGGRTLGTDGPKYKNSPETAIYQKSRLLYGLNWAKAEIVAKGEVIICEGYTDVMAFALSGAPNAVATCGTALADDHVRALKNLARRAILAYDADSAGQGAAQQWYRWEHEFELQVRVADLPPGRDPGDLWKTDRPQLLAALEQAKPFLQFRLDRMLADADTSSAEGRAMAAERAAEAIAEHPNELVRNSYLEQVAGQLDVDYLVVKSTVDRLARLPASSRPGARPGSGAANRSSGRDGREPGREGGSSPEPPPPPTPRSTRAIDPSPGVARREQDLLRWAIHEPELVAEWLDPSLFDDAVVRGAFVALTEHHDFHDALDATPGASRELLERLAVEEPFDDGDRGTLQARLIVNTVEPVAGAMVSTMLGEGDERAMDVKRSLSALAHDRELGEWEHARQLAVPLLGWIIAKRTGE